MQTTRELNALSPPALAALIVEEAGRLRERPRVMEVCGTHTQAIFRHGLKDMLKGTVELVSGPGCPVCVTPDATIVRAVRHAEAGHVVASFGDMMRVPGNAGTLLMARAAGADVRLATSPLDAAAMAAANPRRPVVFLGVGFETTTPGTALLLARAATDGLDNLYVLAAHKLIPPAMTALLAAGEQRIAGFICPGHVSTIIGLEPYAAICAEHHIPCVVGGFEPTDILAAILMIVRQLAVGEARVENQYARAVRPEGNPKARRLVASMFHPVDSAWRGLGVIPGSGLALNGDFSRFDAERAFPMEIDAGEAPKGCLCGEILRGLRGPGDCPHFGGACTPEAPKGPCMVSSEGACAVCYTLTP